MKNITIEEIIKRKLAYIKQNPDNELRDVDEGYINAFSDMLTDMNLSESEFVEKYSKSIFAHQSLVDSVMDGERVVADFGRLSGYNNAVVEILTLLDTNYMFM